MEAKGTIGKSPIVNQALDYYNKTVQPQILQELKALPKLKWVTFALLSNDKGSVVQVVAKNPGDQGWKSFTSKIQPILKKAPTPTPIQVEIVTGQIDLLGGDGANDQTLPIYPYALGRSCNIDGVLKGSGTLGGYLKVTDNASKAETIYGLTNNHVVNLSLSTKVQNPTEPLHVYSGNKILIPSQEDFKTMQKDFKDAQEKSKKTQENPKKTQEKSKKTQEDTKKQQDLSTVPEKPITVGTLEYASGRRVTTATPHVMLDWALVKIAPGKYETDRKKKKYAVNSTPNADIPSDLKSKTIAGSIGSRLYGGMPVYKYGRTTKWTCGEINETRFTINIAEAEAWRGGKINRPADVDYTTDWVIYGDNCEFCKPGDSGSWILDSEGRLVGLLWGSVQVQTRTAVFVTDIHTILDNIRTNGEFQGKTIDVLAG